ncbi:MAG TPA: glycosyltransferase family 39 protein [Dyella sp.]|nr:glycosyltransferase family 39 protein [Dyella sp.]
MSTPGNRVSASGALSPWVWAITAVVAVLHLACAGQYDIFRNELYFIVCGRHPAFGYVDQPPLVPLLAAATQLFGIHVWLLRWPAVAAAAALVPLSAAFARLLGGDARAQIVVSLAAALTPALTGLTTTLTTATFEPLTWTASAFFLTYAWLRNQPRALIWAGVVAGISMQAKYGIVIWLLALFIGLLATPARRILRWRECWIGVGIAALIALPSVAWQALHGWPFLTLVADHAPTNLRGGPVRFEIHQILALNLVLAPLWITGVIAPFASPSLKPLRFLAIALIAATVIDQISGGKDYYLFGAYPAMFAIGAVACRQINKWLLGAWMLLATAQMAIVLPVVLPVLSPPALAHFLDRTHLRPPPDEIAGIGAPLTQVFSDELGWRELATKVTAIYRALPADQQQNAAIFGSNYGEAAAIDVYGRDAGLPPAISGQNQYFLWGPRGHDGSVVIHIGGDPQRWSRLCDSVEVVDQFGVQYAMPYENQRPIFICRGMHKNLSTIWSHFGWYI